MVANDKLRKVDEAINDNRNTEDIEGRTALQDNHALQTHTEENHENTGKDHAKLSCYFKPLPSPKIRHRKQKVSMFEVQPKFVKETSEVQEICIETGNQQYVKERATILPKLSSNLTSSDHITELYTAYPIPSEENVREKRENPITFRGVTQSHDFRQNLKVVGKDNGWMSLGSKLETSYIPSCPGTPPVSPGNRRRSLGVLMSPAWGLRTYRDPENVESSKSPSFRRRSLVVPGRLAQDQRTVISLKKKCLISPDVAELTTHKDCVNCSQLSNSAEELGKPSEDEKLNSGNNSQRRNPKNINNKVTEMQTNANSDDEFIGDFRPRLRSRSLDEYRTQARENVLKNRQRRCFLHGPEKRRENRKKSFDVWLTDKEQETVKKLQMLTLEKQHAAEDEARRKELRKGKTYEEWLDDKMEAEKEGSLDETKLTSQGRQQEGESEARGKEQRKGKTYEEWLDEKMAEEKEDSSENPDEMTKQASQERQETAQRRYEKWLMEKEAQGLEKEREMLKQAKLKTIEMRKKNEEKKLTKFKFFTGSIIS